MKSPFLRRKGVGKADRVAPAKEAGVPGDTGQLDVARFDAGTLEILGKDRVLARIGRTLQ